MMPPLPRLPLGQQYADERPRRYPYLARIDAPADLRQVPDDELPAIADELRPYLIESVASSGGHFGAGLGVVELTVALHYLFDTPRDRLVWDVGHQCYPHKILTGRRDRITTIKQEGRPRAVPEARGKRVRHLRRRPFLHLDLAPRSAWRSRRSARATSARSSR